MSDDQDIEIRIQEVEKRISDAEESLQLAKSHMSINRLFIIVSIGYIIFIGGDTIIPKIGGFFLLCLNGWRLYRNDQKKKKIEDNLPSYQDKKAELQAALTGEE